MQKKPDQQRGFTLVEMLVVLGVFGIVIVAAMGSLLGIIKNSRKTHTNLVFDRAGKRVLQVLDHKLLAASDIVDSSEDSICPTSSPFHLNDLKIKSPVAGDVTITIDSGIMKLGGKKLIDNYGDQVTISNTQLTCYSGSSGKKSVIYSFTLSLGSNSKSFDSSVLLRNSN